MRFGAQSGSKLPTMRIRGSSVQPPLLSEQAEWVVMIVLECLC